MAGCEYKKGAQKEADARSRADKGNHGSSSSGGSLGGGSNGDAGSGGEGSGGEAIGAVAADTGGGDRHKALSKGWKHIKPKAPPQQER